MLGQLNYILALENLVKMMILMQDFSCWGLRFCISHKLQVSRDNASLKHTLSRKDLEAAGKQEYVGTSTRHTLVNIDNHQEQYIQ